MWKKLMAVALMTSMLWLPGGWSAQAVTDIKLTGLEMQCPVGVEEVRVINQCSKNVKARWTYKRLNGYTEQYVSNTRPLVIKVERTDKDDIKHNLDSITIYQAGNPACPDVFAQCKKKK